MPPAPVNAEGGGTTASLSALPISTATDTTTTVLNMVNARLAELSADALDTTTVDTVDESGTISSQPIGGLHWHMFTKSNDPLDVQSHNSPRASKRQIFVTGGKHRQTKSFDDVKSSDTAEAEKPDRFDILVRQHRRHSFACMRGMLEQVHEASQESSLQTSLRPSLDTNEVTGPGTDAEPHAVTADPAVVQHTK